MHSETGIAAEQRVLDLLHEQSLPTNVLQRTIPNLIPHGFDRQEANLKTLVVMN